MAMVDLSILWLVLVLVFQIHSDVFTPPATYVCFRNATSSPAPSAPLVSAPPATFCIEDDTLLAPKRIPGFILVAAASAILALQFLALVPFRAGSCVAWLRHSELHLRDLVACFFGSPEATCSSAIRALFYPDPPPPGDSTLDPANRLENFIANVQPSIANPSKQGYVQIE